LNSNSEVNPFVKWQKSAEGLFKRNEEKTWSQKMAETIFEIASRQEEQFSFASKRNQDFFTFGKDTVVLTKRLEGGGVGTPGGNIVVHIKKSDVEQFSWLKEALEQHPIDYVID
jgi:hypothetical protein